MFYDSWFDEKPDPSWKLRPETLDVLAYADKKIKELEEAKKSGLIDELGLCRGEYRYSCMMWGALKRNEKDATQTTKVCPEAYV